MDQQQRDLRRAAAEAFIESLDKLQETLSGSENSALEQAQFIPNAVTPDMLDRFEQAVADIEQFMEQHTEE